MSKKGPELFIQDMLEAIEKIERYTGFIKDSEEFKKNNTVADAVPRNLEIIGEAKRNILGDIRTKYSEVPWNRIAGLRNSLFTATLLIWILYGL